VGLVVAALLATSIWLTVKWVRTQDELDRRTATLADTSDQLASTQSSLADRETELSAREQELATREQELADRTETLKRILADLVTTRGDLASTLDTLGATTADRDRLAGELRDAGVQLGNLQSSLDAASHTITLQSGAIDTLQRCLAGVTRALNSVSINDTAKALESLQAVRSDCQKADELARGGTKPAYPFDFADPFLLAADGRYYGFATEAAGGNVQVISSPDLVTWSPLRDDALTTKPAWSGTGPTWAPAVYRRGDGKYVLFHSVNLALSAQHCISAAVADAAAGPYRDDSTEAVVCQSEAGGAIDPDVFVAADGRAYLLWKTDHPTQPAIFAQQLTPDGMALTGPRAQLLRADKKWEEGIIEGPELVLAGGRLHLLCSAGRWDTTGYAIGQAVCTSPLGPCTKSANPLLVSRGEVLGPGGPTVVRDKAGKWWLGYHAWLGKPVGYPNSRKLFLRPITFSGATAQV